MNKILVVDDDANILKVIKMRLESKDYSVIAVNNVIKAVKIAKNQKFDMALLDLKIDQDNGIDLMEKLLKIHPEMSIIILTAYGTIESAVDAIQKGAYSYLTKPFDHKDLLVQISNAIKNTELARELKKLKNKPNKNKFENIIGTSKAMKQALDFVAMAAKTDSVINIEGESGTGKELIAKALHLAGSRKNGPFVAINCAAIPDTLFEGEIFGFKKGAFTGAIYNKKGFFAQADGGTILLDEISEMSLPMQTKLLRVLEEREFYPLGSEKPVKMNARVIASSNKDLKRQVQDKKFRNDLFYRIYVIPIRLPSLRERKEDIPLLANYFLMKFKKKMKKNITGFSRTALHKLTNHSWPGNVRELENAVEYAVAMVAGDIINDDNVLVAANRQEEKSSLKSLKQAKSDFEQQYIVKLMEHTHGNITLAAKLSKKYRADLYKILEKYEINPDDFRTSNKKINGG